ncbi:hypothetical protein ACJIZ3_015009 [Penstemon smallii]|uniref:BHLH domain-containing protein n=1 Tax=Penstemon smallii TaxID=265156 RepID=A0ABD3RPC1_9LAMI
MELTQHSLIDELIMAPKIDNNWNLFPNDFFPNSWTLSTTSLDQSPDLHIASTNNPSLLELISPQEYIYPSPFGEFHPFLDALTSQEFDSFYELPPQFPTQEDYASNVENQELDFLENGFENGVFSYKVENAQIESTPNMDIYNNNNNNVDLCGEKKSKSKKPEGQPSKNLMAERRRRKRLNDRLSMLRSIVPKISKMDRTSILGDTIDYMRELLDKIHNLKEDKMDENVNQINFLGNYLKELKPNEMLARNPPKFDVERRNQDTRLELCCATRPGLLLSTLSTLDALGLDIQQCVISCFNDFSVQASCYEVAEHRSLVSPEDVKQALFRNAGYGGRCL